MIVNARSIIGLVFTIVALIFTIFPVHTKMKIKSYTLSLNYEIAPPLITFILCCTTVISG